MRRHARYARCDKEGKDILAMLDVTKKRLSYRGEAESISEDMLAMLDVTMQG